MEVPQEKNEGYSLITEFSDIMAKEMLEYAKTCKAAPVQSDTDTVSAVTTTTSNEISSISQDKVFSSHTKIFLDGKHQL